MNNISKVFLCVVCFFCFSLSANSEEPLPGQVLGIYGGQRNEAAYGVVNAPDGGFLLYGTTESFGYVEFERPIVLIIKVDSQGKIVWQKDFEREGEDEVDPFGVIATRDGGCIIGIRPFTLLKIDNFGNVIWQKAIKTQYEWGSAGVMTEELADGGVILAGAEKTFLDEPWNYESWIAK